MMIFRVPFLNVPWNVRDSTSHSLYISFKVVFGNSSGVADQRN